MAAAALSSGRGAGLPELLEIIQKLAGRMDQVSIFEISELIEQDPVISTRLVAMANLIAHNPGMTTLSGVTHAIHQLGLQRVRSLAISLMLLKSSGTRQNPTEQRQAAARALCAGLMAQACARQMPAMDAEMVFTCTTLRQLGRIILPVVSLEHYRAAMKLAHVVPEAEAFRQHFGLTPLELSRELLKPYQLPAEVRQGLDDYNPDAPRGGSATAFTARLTGLAEYGGRLTQIVLDAGSTEADFAQASAGLAHSFGALIPDSTDRLASTLSGACDRLAQFTHIPGASAGPELLLRRIRARIPRPAEPDTGLPPAAAATATPAPAAPAAPAPEEKSAAKPAVPAAKPTPARPAAAPLESLPDAITLVPEPVRVASPAEPWLEVLRPVQAGFTADDCAVFLRSASRGPFVLADGLGRFVHRYHGIASVHPEEKSVFSIALGRRETVVIHDARTASLAPFLPSWFKPDDVTPVSFLLAPLCHRDAVCALVLVGWTKPRRIELSPGHEAVLNLLRSSAPRLVRDHPRGAMARSAG